MPLSFPGARAIAAALLLALVAGCQPKLPSDTAPPTGGESRAIQAVSAKAHVPTTRSPHGVTVAHGRVYVCNVGSDVLTVLDAATGAKQADLVVQQGPTYAATSHDGARVLVVNGASGSLSLVEAGGAVTHVAGVGSKPDKVHETSDGRHAYVTLVGESAVAKIDLQANPPTSAKIPVGAAEGHRSLIVLADMAIAPDSAANTVRLIDRQTDAVHTVTVGTKPNALAVSSFDGRRVLVVGNGGSNTASLIDLATKEVVKTLDVGIAPSDAVAVGQHVYLTNAGSNTVSVIDAKAQAIATTLPVGKKPVHAFVAPTGGGGPTSQVWIGNDGDSFVTLLDATRQTVHATVECQGGHHKMAFSPDGKKAFITNLASNSVTVIDRAAIP